MYLFLDFLFCSTGLFVSFILVLHCYLLWFTHDIWYLIGKTPSLFLALKKCVSLLLTFSYEFWDKVNMVSKKPKFWLELHLVIDYRYRNGIFTTKTAVYLSFYLGIFNVFEKKFYNFLYGVSYLFCFFALIVFVALVNILKLYFVICCDWSMGMLISGVWFRSIHLTNLSPGPIVCLQILLRFT